ncbi:MAG TPA: RDD family protein [Thermomicrobiales bacterium]|nr:RDD family protein [Thermomicrobiales bacterium]
MRPKGDLMQLPPNQPGPEQPYWPPPTQAPYPYGHGPGNPANWFPSYRPIYSYASFWRRFVAACILDPIIVGLCWLVLWIAVVVLTSVGPATTPRTVDWSDWLHDLVLYGFPFLYHVYGTTTGGTPGFRMLGLQVTLANGSKPDARASLIRQWAAAVGVAGQFLMLLIADLNNSTCTGSSFIGILWIGIIVIGANLVWFFGCFVKIDDPHRQALDDRMAGTYVIHRQ